LVTKTFFVIEEKPRQYEYTGQYDIHLNNVPYTVQVIVFLKAETVYISADMRDVWVIFIKQ
jgi:hypothetical protein